MRRHADARALCRGMPVCDPRVADRHGLGWDRCAARMRHAGSECARMRSSVWAGFCVRMSHARKRTSALEGSCAYPSLGRTQYDQRRLASGTFLHSRHSLACAVEVWVLACDADRCSRVLSNRLRSCAPLLIGLNGLQLHSRVRGGALVTCSARSAPAVMADIALPAMSGLRASMTCKPRANQVPSGIGSMTIARQRSFTQVTLAAHSIIRRSQSTCFHPQSSFM